LQIELVRIKLRILLEPPRGPFQSLIQHFLQQISVIFVGQGGSQALESLLDQMLLGKGLMVFVPIQNVHISTWTAALFWGCCGSARQTAWLAIIARSWFDIHQADLPFPQIQQVVGVEELLPASELELTQSAGSQMAATANLLAVDPKTVKRMASPTESQLENFVQLFQRQIVGNRYQAHNEWADFQ